MSQIANQWFLENARALDLKVEKYTWTNTWKAPLIDCSLSIRVSGRPFKGRGTARSFDEAFTIAGVEAIERSVLSLVVQKGSTNGLALHTTIEKAQENAFLEFCERDAFLCHHLLSKPMTPIPLDRDLATEFADILAKLAASNIQTSMLRMNSEESQYIVLCVMRPIGSTDLSSLLWFEMGAKASYSAANAQYGAFVECVRNTIAYLGNDTKGLQPPKKVSEPQDHRLLRYLRPELAMNILNFNQHTKFEPTTPLSVTFEKISLPAPLSEAPVVAVKCHCSDGQDLFFGKVSSDKVSLSRLSQVAGLKLDFDDLNQDYHVWS